MQLFPKNKISFEKIRSAFFFALIIGLGLSLTYLMRPFFYPLFWAAIIAILFHPLYKFVRKHLKRSSLSSFVTVILVLVILFVPITILASLLIQQSITLLNNVAPQPIVSNVTGSIASILGQTPLYPLIERFQTNWIRIAEDATKSVSIFLFNNIKNITQDSVSLIFKLFLTLYTLYYFFKDGEGMLKKFMHFSPLGDRYETMLYDRFTSTVKATIKGNFIIGSIQGLLGALLFSVADVRGSIVLGMIMVFTAMIPGVGAFIVWLPTALVMLALGKTWQGITIIVFGAFVISLLDNVLRPALVGKDTQMHPIMVLFSTLGGIFIFGLSGFIIGPAIAALSLSAISIYDLYFNSELENN